MDPYQEGKDAYWDMTMCCNNPYDVGTKEHVDWEDGWWMECTNDQQNTENQTYYQY